MRALVVDGSKACRRGGGGTRVSAMSLDCGRSTAGSEETKAGTEIHTPP